MFHLSAADERQRLQVGDLARTHHGNIVVITAVHPEWETCDIYFPNTAVRRTGYAAYYLTKI